MHPMTNRIITGLNQSIRIRSGSGNLFQKRMSEGLRLLYVIIINHYLWFFFFKLVINAFGNVLFSTNPILLKETKL